MRINWSKWDPLLGTMPDLWIANKIGCYSSAVWRRRVKLGVEGYRGKGNRGRRPVRVYKTVICSVDGCGKPAAEKDRIVNPKGLCRDHLFPDDDLKVRYRTCSSLVMTP